MHAETSTPTSRESSRAERARSALQEWIYSHGLAIKLCVATGLSGLFVGIGVGDGNSQAQGASVSLEKKDDQPIINMADQGTRIDKRFLRESLSPEVLRAGLEGIFGTLLSGNVVEVEFSPESIRMPRGVFHGAAAKEAGHCTFSTRRGERSGIVITVDGLPREISVEDFLETLIHEVAHSIDWENADGMPDEIRGAIESALHDLVSGDQTTVFANVNEYEAGPQATQAQAEEEEFRQKKELFAEILQDFIRMPPLAAHDPLHRFTLEERYARRFALRHNITVQEAERYVRVIMAVETWQQGRSDNGFFEKAQVRYANFADLLTRSHEQMLRQEGEELGREYATRDRGLTEDMERWAYPELSPMVARISGLPGGIPRDPDIQAVSRLCDDAEVILDSREAAQRGWIAPGDIQGERVPGTLSASERVREYRRAYLHSLVQTIQSPELKRAFFELTGSGLRGGEFFNVQSGLSLVAEAHRGALEHRRRGADDNREYADRIYEGVSSDVQHIERILWKAEHDSDASPADRQAFRTALQQFCAGEVHGTWWRNFIAAHPDVLALAHNFMSVP